MSKRWRYAVILTLCGAVMAAVVIRASRTGSKQLPNVVLICVDALRADHIHAAGYRRDTTPNLDRLIERSVHFRHAYSQYTSTWRSIGSLFASRHPYHLTWPSDRAALGRLEPYPIVPLDFPVIAEYFHKHGYLTAALTANPVLTSAWGYARGFDSFYLVPPDPHDAEEMLLYARAGRVNEMVRQGWEDALRRDQPLFLYVHYMDPHMPYMPLEPFRGRYCKGLEKSERLDWLNVPMQQNYAFYQTLSEGDAAYMRARYDEEIRYFDHEFGKLLEALEKKDGLKNTILVLFADHGEQFLEHGFTGHDNACHIEEVHVPLVICGERFKPRAIDEPVGLIDIFPTLVDLIGKDPEALAYAEGRSLARLLRGKRRADAGEAVVLSAGNGSVSARSAGESYVLYHALEELYGSVHHEFGQLAFPATAHHFYRLDSDPREGRDLFGSQTVAAARLNLLLRTTFERVVGKDYWLGRDILAAWRWGDTERLTPVLTLAPAPSGVTARLAAGPGGHSLDIANQSSTAQGVEVTIRTRPNTTYLFGAVYAAERGTPVRFALRDGDTVIDQTTLESQANSHGQWTKATRVRTDATTVSVTVPVGAWVRLEELHAIELHFLGPQTSPGRPLTEEERSQIRGLGYRD